MVDRGAYTVGLGIVRGRRCSPITLGAADHRRERSVQLQPDDAVLVGLDEHTAIVHEPSGNWNVMGSGNATVYRGGDRGRASQRRRGARARSSSPPEAITEP